MNFETFQRKIKHLSDVDIRRLNREKTELAIACLGLAGDTGYLIEVNSRLHYVNTIDDFNCAVGDCLCKMARICTAMNIELSNFEKLNDFELLNSYLPLQILEAADRMCLEIAALYENKAVLNLGNFYDLIYDYMSFLSRLVKSVEGCFLKAAIAGVSKLELAKIPRQNKNPNR